MVYGSLCAMCFGISIAQGCVFCWLAKHIAQGTGRGQGNTDLYGLVRTCTDEGHKMRVSPVL